MARIIRVERCDDCPHSEEGGHYQIPGRYLGCTLRLDPLGWNWPVGTADIPDWCPLPEAEPDHPLVQAKVR